MDLTKINLLCIKEFTDADFKETADVFTEILNICEAEGIHTLDDFREKYPEVPVHELFQMLDLRSSNTNVMKPTMKDLTPLSELYDRITSIFTEDEDYLSFILQKAAIQFKMRNPDLGEETMLSYIDKHPDEAEPYVELMFFFEAIAHDRESALYYGDLALGRDTLDDRSSVEEFINDLEEQ